MPFQNLFYFHPATPLQFLKKKTNYVPDDDSIY